LFQPERQRHMLFGAACACQHAPHWPRLYADQLQLRWHSEDTAAELQFVDDTGSAIVAAPVAG
jgi:hypothetical protein